MVTCNHGKPLADKRLPCPLTAVEGPLCRSNLSWSGNRVQQTECTHSNSSLAVFPTSSCFGVSNPQYCFALAAFSMMKSFWHRGMSLSLINSSMQKQMLAIYHQADPLKQPTIVTITRPERVAHPLGPFPTDLLFEVLSSKKPSHWHYLPTTTFPERKLRTSSALWAFSNDRLHLRSAWKDAEWRVFSWFLRLSSFHYLQSMVLRTTIYFNFIDSAYYIAVSPLPFL